MDTGNMMREVVNRAVAARIPMYKLCQRAGVPDGCYYGWKSGRYKQPSLVTIDKLEKAVTLVERQRENG